MKNMTEMKNTMKKSLNEQVTMAVQLASRVHAEQVDKGGHPYILHPMRVATSCRTLEATVAALLHDVLEDTPTSAEDLLEMGFWPEIVEAVQALTKREGEDYFDFVLRAKQNRIAREVKAQDIRDNMNLDRIPNPTDVDFERCKKYMKALWLLEK